ncbi:MAG: hypothetical protein WC803_06540 [Sphingomonas sp.]
MAGFFSDKPVHRQQLPTLFALLFDADVAHGIKLPADRGRAATMRRAPGHTSISAGEMLPLALSPILTFARAIARAMAV